VADEDERGKVTAYNVHRVRKGETGVWIWNWDNLNFLLIFSDLKTKLAVDGDDRSAMVNLIPVSLIESQPLELARMSVLLGFRWNSEGGSVVL